MQGDCGIGFYMNRKRDYLVPGNKVVLVPYRPDHVEKFDRVLCHQMLIEHDRYLTGTTNGCRARSCARKLRRSR